MSENISELTNDQIQARLSEIVTEFGALELSVDSSDEDIAKGESLASEVRSLREELSNREAAAAEKAAKVAEIGEAFAKLEPHGTELQSLLGD